MEPLLNEYKKQLNILIESEEYDDELINELGISFIREYRMEISGFSFPLLFLGKMESQVDMFRRKIFEISQKIKEANQLSCEQNL
jgi:hypothetical protein